MAALTTLSRLLEAKVVELEGDDGTGPLETDIALLQARCAQRLTHCLLCLYRWAASASLKQLEPQHLPCPVIGSQTAA